MKGGEDPHATPCHIVTTQPNPRTHLEVAVHDRVRVQVRERAEELQRDRLDLGLGERRRRGVLVRRPAAALARERGGRRRGRDLVDQRGEVGLSLRDEATQSFDAPRHHSRHRVDERGEVVLSHRGEATQSFDAPRIGAPRHHWLTWSTR